MKGMAIILCGAMLLSPWGQRGQETALGQGQQAVTAVSGMKVIRSKQTADRTENILTLQMGSSKLKLLPAGHGGKKWITLSELSAVPALPNAADTKTSKAKVLIRHGRETTELTAAEMKEFVPPENGTYEYEISLNGIKYELGLKVDLAPVVTVDTETAAGEAVTIRVSYAGDQKVTGKCDTGVSPQFYQIGPEQVALLPINYNTAPGSYGLTVSVGEKSYPYTVQVKDGNFVEQHLTVDESTASATIESKEANQEWNNKIEPLKLKSEPVKYWNGPFQQPVEGKITTEFGMARYTNDNPTPSRHSGIDIAAPLDTPVPASNDGKVLFAGYLKLTGNTVIIEHGLGLKSWYYHMNSLSTEEGAMVKKGDVIGKVGSTGFSTGPHLHFAMSVNQVFTDPWTAFETGYGL